MQLDHSTSLISIPINPIPSEHPPQVKVNITYMDNDLFKAAQNGDMELFNKYQGGLHCLVDGRQNTALHIYSRTGLRLQFPFSETMIPKRQFSITFVKQLVDKCPSLLLQPNVKGEIPLHIAARHGHSDMVKFLIERAKVVQQEDVEKGLEATIMKQMMRMTDKDGNTAMHKAVQSGKLDVVRLLVKELDPDFSFYANTSGETPLYIAAKAKKNRLVAEILDNCKSTDYGGPDGRTALHAAVMVSDGKSVRKLIEANKHLTKETDPNGRTPLHYAAHYNCRSIVKLLLKSEASAAYITDKVRGMTALHMAACGGRIGIMEDIISHCPGCCEIVDKRGWNFLHFAALTLRPLELNAFLIFDDYKIKDLPIRNLVDEKDCDGNTPFELLLFGSVPHADAVKFFECYASENRRYIELNSETKKEQVRKLLKNIAHEVEAAGLSIHFYRNVVAEDIPKHEIMEKAQESHLVVATLVATVTFAAAFTVPGGYRNDEQGTATLIRDSAFKAFVITNTLAFVASLLATTFHFILVMCRGLLKKYVKPTLIRRADQLTVFALVAMVIAFSTGTYAVLQSSSGFAITALFFGLIFFPLSVALFLFDLIYSVIHS